MILADISHWQNKIDFAKVKKSVEAVIVKASEGTSFIDPYFETNKRGVREAGMLFGAYHFAKGYDAKKEANFFVKTVGELKPGELLALDSETGQSPLWCKTFLDEVTRLVGFRPLIYCPAGNGMDWSQIAKDYGLWIARYGLNLGYKMTSFPPKLGAWSYYAIWQYTSRGRVDGINGNVDLNYTSMDLERLKKYGKKDECLHCPIHCK